MCLVTNKFTPFLITIFPKKVYKVVEEYNGELYTPYMDYRIKDDTLKAEGHIDRIRVIKYKQIHGGMIHSFTDKSSASGTACIISAERKSYLNEERYSVLVYEAVIPPFTLYIKGHDEQIASRKIKLIKQCAFL